MSNKAGNKKIFRVLKILGILAISMFVTYLVYAFGNDILVQGLPGKLVHNHEATLQTSDEGVGTGEEAVIDFQEELGEQGDLAGENESPNEEVAGISLGGENLADYPTGIAGNPKLSQEKRAAIPVAMVASRQSATTHNSIGQVPGEISGETSEKAKESKEPIVEEAIVESESKAEAAPNKDIPEEKEPNTSTPAPQPEAGADQDLNKYVLDVIKTYQIVPGRFPYLLNNDYANYNGVTSTLSYQNKVLLKAHPSGSRASHCSGITFEVFFKAMQERNRRLGISPDDFNGMNHSQLFDFAMNWYAAGSKQTHNIVTAVEKYGVGKRISRFEDARPGDFLDFDRENNTGHTVVFLSWIKEGDKIVGLKYWSSQQSTGGIDYNEEYFNVSGRNSAKLGKVMINSVRIARVLPVSEYKSIK